MASSSKIGPLDSRLLHGFIQLRDGLKQHYLYATPEHGSFRATLFLVHDLSYGWRHQVALFLGMGLRVVMPDMRGYGASDAPSVPPNNLALYSIRRASDDIAELASHLGASKIILGGHDWGGFVVYRCAEWHPDLVSHVFSVCTPYSAPQKSLVTLEQVIARAPQFGYQLHLASGEVEKMVQTKEQIRSFLSGMYGARSKDGKFLLDPRTGLDFNAMASMGRSPFVSDEEMDYYVDQFAKNGLHGPCCWYRTREINFREELDLPRSGLDCPVLFIIAERDSVLLPSMAKGIERHLSDVTVRSVPAGHWALWQTAAEVNAHLKDWFESAVLRGSDAKL